MKRLEAGSDGVDLDRIDLDRIWFFVACRYGGAAAGGHSGGGVVNRVVFGSLCAVLERAESNSRHLQGVTVILPSRYQTHGGLCYLTVEQ